MKKVWILLLALYSQQQLSAQNASFINSGKITFEKRVNNHALIEKTLKAEGQNAMLQDLSAFLIKNHNQFSTKNFTLTFNENKSLYQTVENENTDKKNFDIDGKSTVYNDYNTRKSLVQKELFGETFTIETDIRKIKWKITDEYREIAGLQCRRANGIMLDSIYIVAFYSEHILPSYGPESFNGLPGMILGIALPHEHTTWFATQIIAEAIANTQIHFQPKGKRTTWENLKEKMSPNSNYEKFIFKRLSL